MDTETDSLRGNYGQRVSARAGVAKDQLIFIIICSVALAVAVVALAINFNPPSVRPSDWQCLECGYEFSSKTREAPPIDCPKCQGQAVRLDRRKCPACGKRVLVSRMCAAETSEARGKATKAGHGEAEGVLPRPGLLSPQMLIQYWLKQSDGSYGWSPSMPLVSRQAQQIEFNLQCPECGEPMLKQRSSSSRSKRAH